MKVKILVRTVKEVVADLQKYNQDLPVMVGSYEIYDNPQVEQIELTDGTVVVMIAPRTP